MVASAPRIFTLGNGRKFRATPDAGSYNGLQLEVRVPWGWETLKAQDMIDLATKALARQAIGAPVKDFKWSLDDRYVDPGP